MTYPLSPRRKELGGKLSLVHYLSRGYVLSRHRVAERFTHETRGLCARSAPADLYRLLDLGDPGCQAQSIYAGLASPCGSS